MVKKILYANSKRVSMASNKLPDSGTKSLNLLWGSKAIRRLLQIIAYLYKKFSDKDFIILLLYVDDMLIVDKNTSKIDELKKNCISLFL